MPTPENFCLKPGYISRPAPQYFYDQAEAQPGVVWQPEAYLFAAWLGRRLNCRKIIDLGCGQGSKIATHVAGLLAGTKTVA